MRTPPQVMTDWVGKGMALFGFIFCSLPCFVMGMDIEKQELQIAVKALRKERDARQRELTVATNRLVRIEARVGDFESSLLADNEGGGTVREWRAFLMNALGILDETDQEIKLLRKQLSQLVYVVQDAIKTAQKVDSGKRVLLENEIRKSQKFFAETRQSSSIGPFLPEPDTSLLSSAKVIGVNLDLGVAAIGVGRRHDAKVGMPFLVAREKKVLAILVLVEVRENASLALIEQMEMDRPIRNGDVAVLRRL